MASSLEPPRVREGKPKTLDERRKASGRDQFAEGLQRR